MQPAVCTLFEGHYHYGVAALANSLFRSGFRGSIYAGYRGSLPAWCSNSVENKQFDWPGSTTFKVAKDIQIHFLPLDTDYHLTNYKPDFMLQLLSGPAADTEEIYYMDPDIVISVSWSFFKDWSACGVAVCEDLNSPLSQYHPRRMGWRNHYGKSNVVLNFKEDTYVNGGFVGLSKKNFGFLNTWRSLQELMAPVIGGLNRSVIGGKKVPVELKSQFTRFAPFAKTDQDALNAAVEAWDGPISYLDKTAMGFTQGVTIMPHSVGTKKPWQMKFLSRMLSGNQPRLVDKSYWKSVYSPIKVYPKSYVIWKLATINCASFIGRFYSKN
ncbi:MAG TPA: hypothetical protein VGN20_16500 [Mucilaginibacter sp.]|jgi:hypothetical protein